ncbi:MAG: hypothetical protein WKF31_03130 [Thermoleophilaceae bacterium]
MSTVENLQDVENAAGVRHGIVDVDVHPVPRSPGEISQYMQMPFRDRYQGERRSMFNNPVHGSRLDSVPPGGGPKGSDPDFLRRQLIDEYGVAYAILLPRAVLQPSTPTPTSATAIAAAFNDWLADTWLDSTTTTASSRARSPIAHQDPPARPRARSSAGPGTRTSCQVMTDSGARAPFGQRQYYPIYEACEQHGLPLGDPPRHRRHGDQRPAERPATRRTTSSGTRACRSAFQAHLVELPDRGRLRALPGLQGRAGRGRRCVAARRCCGASTPTGRRCARRCRG